MTMKGRMEVLFLLYLFVLCVFIPTCLSSAEKSEEYQSPSTVEELKELLFPNRTQTLSMYESNKFQRKLQIAKKARTGNEPCTTCGELANCPILSGFMVQEVYYPKNTALRETCNVLNDLGGRISSTVFGAGRTFRDTPDCRGELLLFIFFSRFFF
jgi:hypothetical protein